jgi:glycosyltransferase involved in cell wall biosynthesis
MACGTPVIAFNCGGAAESVLDGRTGLFFKEQSVKSIIGAVESFERGQPMDPLACRAQAETFAPERFREQFIRLVNDATGK